MVSIHAPGRGATPTSDLARVLSSVSIHAPGRGATDAFTTATSKQTRFQFTHPGGVRRIHLAKDKRQRGVSIHAPGRGATFSPGFISRHIHGFNSRTREGCDKSMDVA